ncbi:MAG TPA: hypothetical protein VEF06_11235 [Bryobacteraceae bacterium]|nr:hypothetical protein [Bryobacteraceae bacterium]
MHSKLRTLVLLVTLAAMLGVSAASITPAHLHLNSSASRCDLCFTAHFAAVQSPAVQSVHAPELSGPTALLQPYSRYQSLASRPSSSRGPPSLSL